MYKLIVIITIVVFFNSCVGNNTISFLKQCEEIRNKENDKFCLSNLEELKKSIPAKDHIYYYGSDSEFHFFKYHYRTAFFSYDKTASWAVMGFKIPIAEYAPLKEKLFNENNTQKDASILSVSDL